MSLFKLLKSSDSTVSSRQKTGWIGIDIGTGAIKIAQLQRIGGRLRLAHSLVIRADDGCPFDFQSFESGRIGDEVRRALRTHAGFRGQEAACVVSMAHCQLRILESAGGSDDEKRELISLEIENDQTSSTAPPEFEFWDAFTGEHNENRGMTQVHVLSIPQTFSDSIANSLMGAGLQCQVLDAVPFAAIRASEMATPVASTAAADSSYAILDWGYSLVTLMVVHRNQPIMTRTLKHCGLKKLLQAVGQRLKLSGTEADAMLTAYGVSPKRLAATEKAEVQSLITELCSGAIGDLVEEVHETLSFMKMRFPEQVPAHFWLIGGGAAIRNINSLLQQEIRLPVYEWNLRGLTSAPVSPVLAIAAALSALAWQL